MEIMPTVLDATAIAQLTSDPFGPHPGAATNTVLWRNGSSMAGLLTIAGGERLGAHAHQRNHHHMWVVGGAAVVADALLEAGGYAHIPAGLEHDIDATSTDGCTVFYIYERTAT